MPREINDDMNSFVSSYKKGMSFERFLKRCFEDKGYVVIRPSGSEPFDLICLSKKQNLAIEAKYSGRVSKKQREKQLMLAEKAGLVYVTAVRQKDGSIKFTKYDD